MNAHTAVAISMFRTGSPQAEITEATGLTADELHAALGDAATAHEERSAPGATLPDVAALLEWAEAQTGRPATLAARTRSTLSTLTALHDQDQAVAAAQKRADDLRAQLFEAEAELRVARGKTLTSSRQPPLGRDEAARIRSWARTQGLTVQATGSIPAEIRAAYRRHTAR